MLDDECCLELLHDIDRLIVVQIIEALGVGDFEQLELLLVAVDEGLADSLFDCLSCMAAVSQVIIVQFVIVIIIGESVSLTNYRGALDPEVVSFCAGAMVAEVIVHFICQLKSLTFILLTNVVTDLLQKICLRILAEAFNHHAHHEACQLDLRLVAVIVIVLTCHLEIGIV